MALKQMARNPYPYMLLSLLLVLVTGLATFAATVGTTLAKRDDDVVRYDVGADLRIADIGRYVDLAALKRSYEASPCGREDVGGLQGPRSRTARRRR